MKYVTDLKPWFTESMKMHNIVTGAWLITDEKKKQIILKFNESIPEMDRAIYLGCIAKSLILEAASEDVKKCGQSGFGSLMDMMQLREWRKEDEEIIGNGIPHEIF